MNFIREEIKELVETTLKELGIEDCADVLIGGELIKGNHNHTNDINNNDNN